MEDLIQIEIVQKVNKVRKVQKTLEYASSNAVLFFKISIIDSLGEIFRVKNKTHL